MKNLFFVCLGLVYILSIGCQMNLAKSYRARINCIKIDEQNYIEKQKVNKIKPANVLLVQVLNNPFEFSTQSKMIFYINGTPLYKDIFKIQFPVTINLNDKELVHCRIEIIEGDCLYVFEDKSVFNWDVNFKFIYAAFFPDNSTTDNIHFFPQQQLVVQ